MSNEDIIVGIELGSSFFRGIAARRALHAPEGFEVVGWARVPSSGVRRGTVADVTEASRVLTSLKSELEMQLHGRVHDAIVAVSGAHVVSVPARGLVAVARADGEIGDEDVRRAQDAAQAAAIGANREVLHVLEREYMVDSEKGIRDPRGMRGVRLELEALIIAAATSHVRSLEEALGGAGIAPVAFIASPLASARGMLTPRQKELGTLLVDLGAGTTDFSVFEEGRCLHAGTIPVGGAHISNDIAIGLRIPIEVAEEVKHEHGVAIARNAGKRDVVELPGGVGSFTKKQLGEIIEARLLEIFDLLAKELEDIGRARLLPGGVVLGGGSALILQIAELAKARLKLPVALGMPNIGSGPLEVRQDPAFAAPVGMVLLALEEASGKSSSALANVSPKEISNKLKALLRSLLP